MHRISAGLAACLVAAVTVAADRSGRRHQHIRASGRAARAAASAITQADNGKTVCARVGDTVSVLLRSNNSSRWLPPLASSSALQPTPNGAASLVRGLPAPGSPRSGPGRCS